MIKLALSSAIPTTWARTSTRVLVAKPEILRRRHAQSGSVCQGTRGYQSFAANQVSIEELVTVGMNEYRKLPWAYVNMDPNDITFQVCQTNSGAASMNIVYCGEVKKWGLPTVSPWAATNFAHLGQKGNLGMPQYGTKELLDDPRKAIQDIGLSVRPRWETEVINQDMKNYMDWIVTIEHRMCDFLAEHIDEYPLLRAKFGSSGDILPTLLFASLNHKTEKAFKDESGKFKKGTEFLKASDRLYRQSTYSPACFECDLDQRTYEAEGLVPNRVQLFDSEQKPLPLSDNPIRRGYVVSCSILLTPAVIDPKIGLKKTLKTCSVLAKAERETFNEYNPWAAVGPFVGGYRYEEDSSFEGSLFNSDQ